MTPEPKTDEPGRAFIAALQAEIAAGEQVLQQKRSILEQLSTLYGVNGSAAPATAGPGADVRERVLDAIDAGKRKVGEIELGSMCNREVVKSMLKELLADGTVRREGAGPGTTYHRRRGGR